MNWQTLHTYWQKLDLPNRPILAACIILGMFTLAGTGSVGVVHFLTENRIAHIERETLMEAITTLAPPHLFDNDLLADVVWIKSPLLGSDSAQPVYRGRLGGQPAIAVFSPVAPDGYNGAIRLLVAIHADGRLAGVRVLAHKETPGLGDPIDSSRSDWIKQFAGLSLDHPAASRWRVRKDGGDFDQFTGATITPRAVVKAVHQTLQYFAEERSRVFMTAQSQEDNQP
ncbi:MAG: electron transport complex subunit RsxG [Pseudomonadota bacterium]|jgi:electron transport complex protein RnfG